MKRNNLFMPLIAVLAFVCGMSLNLNQAVAAAPHPMMSVQTTVADGHFKFIRADNSVRELRLDVRNEAGGQHLIRVNLYDGAGVHLATPIRFKLTSGGLLAADFPGCSSDHVAVDGNGRIIDG